MCRAIVRFSDRKYFNCTWFIMTWTNWQYQCLLSPYTINSTSNISYEHEHVFLFATHRYLCHSKSPQYRQSNRNREWLINYFFFRLKNGNLVYIFIVGWHWHAFLIVYLFIQIIIEWTSTEDEEEEMKNEKKKRSRTVDDVAGLMTVAQFTLYSF